MKPLILIKILGFKKLFFIIKLNQHKKNKKSFRVKFNFRVFIYKRLTVLNKVEEKNKNTAIEQELKKILNSDTKSEKNFESYASLKNLKALEAMNSSLSQSELLSSYENLKIKLPQEKKKIHLWSKLKYVAIIVGLIALGALLPLNSNESKIAHTIIKAPLAQSASIVLADGSEVYLNSGSHICYNEFNTCSERRVFLEGEAYFIVHKNPNKQFIVETQNYEFKVYGTTFNIQAYPEDSLVTTHLVEGSLGVNKIGKPEFIVLKPSQTLVSNPYSNISRLSKGNTISWHKGEVYFKDESLESICKKLNRWYNVDIVIENNELRKKLITGTIIKDKPLYQVLEVLKIVSGIDYQMTSHSVKKNKIYIY